jgi:secondary thiamine-phosphate synthase enzyme
MLQTLTLRTSSRHEFLDLTREIQAAVQKSGVREGFCHLFVPHTTAALTINENADPSVKSDILMVLNKIISDREPYRHLEGNSPAHIKASLLGPQLTLMVSSGRLVLGTWQGIYLCEFDGPRSRRLHLKVVAD